MKTYGEEIKFKDENGNLLVNDLISALNDLNYFTLDEKVYTDGKVVGFRSYSCKRSNDLVKEEENRIIVKCDVKYTTIYSLDGKYYNVICKKDGVLDLYSILTNKENPNAEYILYKINSVTFDNEIETNSNNLKLRNIKNESGDFRQLEERVEE